MVGSFGKARSVRETANSNDSPVFLIVRTTALLSTVALRPGSNLSLVAESRKRRGPHFPASNARLAVSLPYKITPLPTRFAMRAHFSLVTIALPIVFAANAAAQEFPYTAYISAPQAHVRSGPGSDYYATDRLRIGQAVEVFRHDPQGWAAIRPPADSFSWIRGSALLATDEADVVKVTEDDVVSRVGSRFSQDQEVTHVKLSRGEKVHLLEPDKFEKQEGEDVWVKIAPPSGEFRWVQQSQLDRRPPVGFRKTKGRVKTAEHTTPRKHPGWNHREGVKQVSGEEDASDENQVEEESTPKLTGSNSERFELLELAIAKMIARPAKEWSFDKLHKECQRLVDDAATASLRADARRLLRRVERYQKLKDKAAKAPVGTTAPSRIIVPGTVPTPKELANLPLFDFAGRVVPVISRTRRPDAPPFALTDDQGKVVCFLTPSIGINLAQHVNQHVAVSGPKTFVEKLKKSQVEVRRIVRKDPTELPAGEISRRPATGVLR